MTTVLKLKNFITGPIRYTKKNGTIPLIEQTTKKTVPHAEVPDTRAKSYL